MGNSLREGAYPKDSTGDATDPGGWAEQSCARGSCCLCKGPASAAVPSLECWGWFGQTWGCLLPVESRSGLHMMPHLHCRTRCPLCYSAPSAPRSVSTAPIQHRSGGQVWQALTPKVNPSPWYRGAGWEWHHGQGGKPWYMSYNSEALRDAVRALQPYWCLWGYKQLPRPRHPGPCAQPRYTDMDNSQARHPHPPVPLLNLSRL